MKKLFLTLFVLAFCCGFGFAQEEDGENVAVPQDATQDVFKKIIETGSDDVCMVKTQENGEIISFLAVGVARVSKTLGEGKGREIARQRASMKCDAAVAKYFKTHITVEEKMGEEMFTYIEGGTSEESENDDTKQSSSHSESSKASEELNSKITRYAEGLVRGLQVVSSGYNSQGDFCIVKAYKAKSLKSIKKIEKEMNEGAEEIVQEKKTKKENEKSFSREKKQQKSKVNIMPNASEFL